MKRYIMAISDGPFTGTGFSEELRNILFRLAQTGQFEVSWQCLQHTGYAVDIPDSVYPDLPHKGAKVKIYGTHGDPYHFGADAFLKNYRDINPEMVLFMGDPKNLAPYADWKTKLGFPLIFYVTLDGLPIHPAMMQHLKYANLLVAMTEWAQKEYQKVGFNPAYIHHGINWKWWRVQKEEKIRLREEKGIPEDAVVFINWDVPQHRKRPDALLRAWRDFHPEDKKAILVLFTDWNLEGSLGYNVEGLIEQYKVPRNTIVGPLELQGAPKYWECAETIDHLKESVMIGDVYASATSGEGFGKCGLEAMGMGMPVIITDYAASHEVHQKGSILVPCYEGQAGRYRLDDRRRSVDAGVINEQLLTQAINELYKNARLRKRLGKEAREWSKEFDYATKIIPKWQSLLGALDTGLLAAKELLQI
jgi:glycosyltransferase involved in cell wall biosynthesis